ncbi:MAG TPA: type II secretion system protein [Tepidisphaeraceae bacterium]|jgi:prepilin-type N-terminal cleavage/methylation domain-containing protein
MARRVLYRSATQHGASLRGFTLVELLVSVGIILVMTAFLLPAMNTARASGKAVLCQDNQRRIWQGWLLFATDHDGHLPGSRIFWDVWMDPDKKSWLSGPYRDDDLATAILSYQMRPEAGTIFKYVNQDYRIFRCPALEPNPPMTWPGPGAGSNGRYDYAAFTTFAGCLLAHVPGTATFEYPDGRLTAVPTPIICEEEPVTLNGWSWSESHCNIKQLGHQHRGGSFYVSPDGSVNWFAEPWECDANNWFVTGRHGERFCMGSYTDPSHPEWWCWEFGWGWFEIRS